MKMVYGEGGRVNSVPIYAIHVTYCSLQDWQVVFMDYLEEWLGRIMPPTGFGVNGRLLSIIMPSLTGLAGSLFVVCS